MMGKSPGSITEAEIAPVIGPDNRHAARWDTESIALDGNRLYLGVEGLDRIICYTTDRVKFPAYKDAILFPPGVKDLPPNQGLEALEYIPGSKLSGGILAAFSEKGLDENGNLLAYLIEGTDRKTFVGQKKRGVRHQRRCSITPEGSSDP